MDRVLILGASGLVGRALVKELGEDYKIYGTYHKGNIDLPPDQAFQLNISDSDRINEILEITKPKIVISCLRGDFKKQIEAHKEVARYLREYGDRFYFCSTANVFDADVTRPFYEDDLPESRSDYGKFKMSCEQALEMILGKASIPLRLPMLWGKDSRRLNALRDQLKSNDGVEVYTNLYITTNTDVRLAKQIHYIIANDLRGIFHLASDDIINYYDFITELIEKMGYDAPRIKEKKLPQEKYHLAILSKRDDLPQGLQFTNRDSISDLVHGFNKGCPVDS